MYPDNYCNLEILTVVNVFNNVKYADVNYIFTLDIL